MFQIHFFLGRRGAQNILRASPGPTSYAKRNIVEGSTLSAWRLIFHNSMMKDIKKCTETEARLKLKDETWSISFEELDAFIAILYARGVYGAKNLPVSSFWNKTWGPPFFSDTICRNRFQEILRFLRFDIKTTRSERLKNDKFALASNLWNAFIENSAACYRPRENLTVDEQLLASKARCPFTQYIANKPDKFGIKFWLLVCVHSKYILNGFPYTGKDENRPQDQKVGESVVLRLMEPYFGQGHNVTTDNFFTSLNLSERLKKKATSLVGTLNRIRREVPQVAKTSNQPLHSTILFKKDDTTLTVYQGKKNKNVLLLSSLHPTVQINSNEKLTPETIQFYNETKYGVDVVDQMARLYSTKSGTRRWPVHVFFNVLDFAAINAWILYKETVGEISRRNFILQLCEELRTSYMAQRKKSKNIETSEASPNSAQSTDNSSKRVRCKIRNVCKGNGKTTITCAGCKKSVCMKCVEKKSSWCSKCVKKS